MYDVCCMRYMMYRIKIPFQLLLPCECCLPATVAVYCVYGVNSFYFELIIKCLNIKVNCLYSHFGDGGINAFPQSPFCLSSLALFLTHTHTPSHYLNLFLILSSQKYFHMFKFGSVPL